VHHALHRLTGEGSRRWQMYAGERVAAGEDDSLRATLWSRAVEVSGIPEKLARIRFVEREWLIGSFGADET